MQRAGYMPEHLKPKRAQLQADLIASSCPQGLTMCSSLQDMPSSHPHRRPCSSLVVAATVLHTGASSNVNTGTPAASLKAHDASDSQPQRRPMSSLLVLLALGASEHAGAASQVAAGLSELLAALLVVALLGPGGGWMGTRMVMLESAATCQGVSTAHQSCVALSRDCVCWIPLSAQASDHPYVIEASLNRKLHAALQTKKPRC